MKLLRDHIVRQYTEPGLQTTVKLKHTFPLWLTLLLLLIYLLTLSGSVLLLASALGLTLLISYLGSISIAQHVRGKRTLIYGAIQVGEELEESITLTNQSSLPLFWVEMKDRSDLPGHHASLATAIGGNDSRSWRIRTLCEQRGIFRLGPWDLEMGDPLGLFQVRQTYMQPQEIVVHPSLAALPSNLDLLEGVMGDDRPLVAPIHADSVRAGTTRAYVAGDPLRHIHWPTTARRAKTYVKKFEPEARSILWLMPDLDRTVHSGSGPDSTEEKMIILLASLADHFLRAHISVGLIASSENPLVIPPAPGRAQLWKVLRGLTPLRLETDAGLNKVLGDASNAISHGEYLMLVTPSKDTSWLENWKKTSLRKDLELSVIFLSHSESRNYREYDAPIRIMAEQNIRARTITTNGIHPIEGASGQVRRWEFKTLPLGKSVVVGRPRVMGNQRE